MVRNTYNFLVRIHRVQFLHEFVSAGISLIIGGDLGQLDAVCDTNLFASGLTDARLCSAQAIYHSFRVVNLGENFRAREASYLQLLRNFRQELF